jgi:hypothetical protein
MHELHHICPPTMPPAAAANHCCQPPLHGLQAEYKEALNRQVRRQADDASSSAAAAAADEAFLQSESPGVSVCRPA